MEHFTARGQALRSPHSDNPRTNLRRPDFPDAGKSLGPIDPIRAEVDDEKLVLIAVEDILRLAFEPGDFPGGEHAEKDGELNVFPMVHQEFEEFAASLVPRLVGGDVVGAEIGSPIISQRTTGHGRWGMSPRSRRTSSRAWMRRMVRHEHR